MALVCGECARKIETARVFATANSRRHETVLAQPIGRKKPGVSQCDNRATTSACKIMQLSCKIFLNNRFIGIKEAVKRHAIVCRSLSVNKIMRCLNEQKSSDE